MENMSSMEEVLEQAEKQGLTVVQSDDAGFQNLLADYQRVLGEAEKLCDVVDDEKTPFASKYKAREILDQMLRNMEAHHTICSLEKQRDKMDLLTEKIASLQLKIGTISWDCEEPHNAQKELEEACAFYFPTFVTEINDFIQDREVSSVEEGALHPEVRKVIAPIDFNHIQLPTLPIIPGHLVVDAMRCLNLLGILWAGRAQPYKSLHYLLSAHSIYDLYHPTAGSDSTRPVLSAEVAEDLDNAFTHNLFYLAQAYGNLGNAKQSSHYCQLTLQRQLLQKSSAASTSNSRLYLPDIGLNDYKTALDWVKNCCGIADFYLAMSYYQCCALALASAEKILSEKVIKPLYDDMNEKYGEGTVSATNKPNFSSGNVNAVEIEADLHRRWAALYISVLHRASDREKEIASYQELAGNTTDAKAESERLRNVLDASDQEDEALVQALLQKTAVAPSSAGEDSAAAANKPVMVEFFQHLPVVLPTMLHINDIQSFDQARVLFLRGSAKIEAAKKYFVLDGYVTDHCTLLQENSKLYHYLATFELDLKRRLAMELRRTEMLIPLLKTLNRASYEVLHKQISYELGETALVLIDLKLDKFREKGTGEINPKLLKKSEISKSNEYCKLCYALFNHFIYMYTPTLKTTGSDSLRTFAHLETVPIEDLAELWCDAPDEAQITEEELRPYLNAHFLSCRVLTKIIPTHEPTPRRNTAHYLVIALKRYQWLIAFADRICKRKGVNVQDIFQNEIQICKDMVQLLPSKIDRMCYLGEGGLTL